MKTIIHLLAAVAFLFFMGVKVNAQWCGCDNLATPREQFASAMAHAPLYDYHLFLFGGMDLSGTPLATVEHRHGGGFTCLSHDGDFALPAGPLVNASAVFSPATGKVYLMGGNNGTADVASVWELDPIALTWTPKSPMATPRSAAGATEINGKIYIVGGRSGATVLNSLEEYNPVTDTWVTRAPMPTPRYGLEFVQAGTTAWPAFTRGFAMGGINFFGSKSNVNERYDALTNTWSTATPMPTALAWFGGWRLVDLSGTFIGVLGGENSAGAAVSTFSLYNPVTDTWPSSSSSSVLACVPMSRHEVQQTGDMTDLVFATMSVGGRTSAGIVSDDMNFHGGWAVLEDGQIDLQGRVEEGKVWLGWHYAGKGKVSKFLVEQEVSPGQFLPTGASVDCAAGCASSDHEVRLPEEVVARTFRVVANFPDGSVLFSNVVSVRSPDDTEMLIIPSENGFTLQGGFLAEGQEAQVTLLSVEGRALQTLTKSTHDNEVMLDLGNLPHGMYIVHAQCGNASKSVKVIW